MRYGREHESIQYIGYIQSYSPSSSVRIKNLLISVDDPWLGSSPDVLVYDPSVNTFKELLEIKCTYKAQETSLIYICTKKEQKLSSFCVTYNKKSDQFSLKKTLIFLPDSRSATPYRENLGVIYLFGLLATIQPDKTFWEVMRTNMWHFYTINMLHELMHPWHLND